MTPPRDDVLVRLRDERVTNGDPPVSQERDGGVELPATDAGPIGLLVVHGVGKQNRGATMRGVLKGLQHSYGDAIGIDWVENDRHALITGLGRPVHVIEVYWADLLRGETVEGTFDFARVFEVTWFPSLNARAGLLDPQIVSTGRVRRWTWTLAVLSPVLSCAVYGASLIAMFTALPGRRKRAGAASEVPADRERTWFDNAMDDIAGDVFNYVDGNQGSFPARTARTERIGENVGEIRGRFDDAHGRAVNAGCSEVQVVAHSLGTVIAFNAISFAAATGSETRLTRVYTIGSPLEKFRFFWTPLLNTPADDPHSASMDDHARSAPPAFAWDNFYSPLDLVSGKLNGFPGWPKPDNHVVPQLGGLASSHVAYDANPAFVSALGRGLGGPSPKIRTSRLKRFRRGVLAVLQNLLLPLGIVLLAAFGLAALLAGGRILGWTMGIPVRSLGHEGVARGIELVVVALVFLGGTVFAVMRGRRDAIAAHRKHWAPSETGDRTPEEALV